MRRLRWRCKAASPGLRLCSFLSYLPHTINSGRVMLVGVAVGMPVAQHPPHRPVLALLRNLSKYGELSMSYAASSNGTSL